MAKPTRRIGVDPATKRLRRNVTIAFLSFGLVLLVVGHLQGKKRRLPFARTRVPGPFTNERPLALQFAPDGEKVFVVSRDALRVYAEGDTALGGSTPVFTVDGSTSKLSFEGTYLAAVSGNGRELAIVRQLGQTTNHELDVIGIEHATEVEKIPVDRVSALSLSSSGMRALVGSSNSPSRQSFVLWDIANAKNLEAHDPKAGPLARLELSPDDKRALAIFPGGKGAQEWTLGSEKHIDRKTLDPAIYVGPARIFGLDGTNAVFWDTEKDATIAVESSGAKPVALARLGEHKVVGVDENHVFVWDLESKKLEKTIDGDKPELGKFESVTGSPRGNAVVVATHEGEILWLDLPE